MRALAASVLALLASNGASGAETSPAQFVVEVPVSLRRLPSNVQQGAVTCILFGRRPDQAGDERYLGSGSERFTPRRGAFEGRVNVPVTLDLADGDAAVYRCTLYFIYADGETKRARSVRSLTDNAVPGFAADPREPFVPEVRGAVPSAER